MHGIRLVIFDLDGTLINAYPAITASFNRVMRSLQLPLMSRQVIRRAVGWGDERLLRPFVPAVRFKDALKLYRRYHKADLTRLSCLYPGVKSMLAYLKAKGYKLAVASNRPSAFSLILLKHLDLGKYFDYVLCADKLPYGKPHPMVLNRIRQRFVFNPAQVLYVGDMTIDAIAGRRAHLKTIIVTTGSSTREEAIKEKPYLVISRVNKLKAIL